MKPIDVDEEALAARGCLTILAGTAVALLALLALYALDRVLAEWFVALLRTGWPITLPPGSDPSWEELAGELFVAQVVILGVLAIIAGRKKGDCK